MSRPNAVLEMYQADHERLKERAEDINDRQVALDESKIHHEAIAKLADSEGWAAVVEKVEREIESLRKTFESQVDAIELAKVQGQVATLRWFSLIPSLSEAMLIAIGQAQEALNAEKDEFVQTGA